jgi:hypothetical protein
VAQIVQQGQGGLVPPGLGLGEAPVPFRLNPVRQCSGGVNADQEVQRRADREVQRS